MQITHGEARKLVQFKADKVLNSNRQETLNAHLKDCVECAAYANEVREAEETLRSVMQKHWNLSPLPLNLDAITAKVNSRSRVSALLATRKALIGVVVMVLVFVVWQFTTSNDGSISPVILRASPIPTPSPSLTSTKDNLNHCKRIQYKTRGNDTLESIARQFFTSKEAIMNLNNLQSENINPSTELLIPICDLTPTSTIHPPTFTTTPIIKLTTYTPG